MVLTHQAHGTYDLFVDGTGTGQSFRTAANPDAGPRPMAAQPMWIGGQWNGVVDELAIYPHALSATRIRAH